MSIADSDEVHWKNEVIIMKFLSSLFCLTFVLILGCSSNDNDDSIQSTVSPIIQQPEPLTFCQVFLGIQKATEESGGELSSEADWRHRISWTQQLYDTAPMEYKDEALIYLELVKDRAELLAKYNYQPLPNIPAEARTAFISDHIDEQQVANKLIAYAKSSCMELQPD